MKTNEANDLKNQDKYTEKVKSIIEEKRLAKGNDLFAYIGTFGCQQNEADSEKLAGTAVKLGYKITHNIEESDLIIFNTCAVREHAELRALSKTGQLKHLKDNNPNLLIGLWGCMVTQEHRKEDIKHKYPYVDFVAGTNMLHRLAEILCDVMVSDRRRYYVDDTPPEIVEGMESVRESNFKAWLSVMYGCNNFCTYCVVPYVRGRERSRLPENVISEASQLAKSGYREITLLGQNVNSYGKTLSEDKKINFAELLDRICDIDGDFWVRFMTSHPKDASDELIRVMAKNKKAAKHFHLPIQSGSNAVLEKMNRRYTREAYLELAMKLKQAMPDITLSTDIIVGFPGETEKDFEDTLDIIKKVRFESIYSFIYSPRKGTPAAEMDCQIEKTEQARRFSLLTEAQSKISDEINASYIGKTLKVLVDEKNENGLFCARTEGNKVIRVKSEKDLYGCFASVNINEILPGGLYGKLI